MPYFVYCITNIINKKSYIGSTESIKNRFRMHKWMAKNIDYKDARLVHHDINKYGLENFTFQILEQFESEREMFNAEFWYMEYLQTIIPNGYNLVTGLGQTGNTVLSYSLETRNNIIKDYVENLMNIRDLEIKYDLSREVIRKIVPENIRKERQHQARVSVEEKLQAVAKYQSGERPEDIGEQLGISFGTVYKILREYDVALRHDHHRKK